jgi:post-GPI attachment to proteins factor 2
MRKREDKMLPEYQRLKEDELGGTSSSSRSKSSAAKFTIGIGNFSLLTVSLPLFSFIFCVTYSLVFYFEQSTSTHCHTWNYLPSISAAIGSFQPQAIVWQTAIVIHFIPRLIVTWIYYSFFQRVIRRNHHQLANIAIALNFVENICLLGLSLYNSTDYYGEHSVFIHENLCYF